jgi:hypothetical protein
VPLRNTLNRLLVGECLQIEEEARLDRVCAVPGHQHTETKHEIGWIEAAKATEFTRRNEANEDERRANLLLVLSVLLVLRFLLLLLLLLRLLRSLV